MASSRGEASAAAARQYGQIAKEAYDIGVPGIETRNALLMPALRLAQAGQLPEYMTKAFETQRTGLQEGIANQERAAIQRQDMGAKGAVAGGNAFSTMNPAQMGQVLADAMTGSRVQQGMATVNQANTLMQMGLGGAGQAGNAAVGAAGNNLNAISMLPNYNPTYAAVLGGVNAAGTIYGAGKQAGWWGNGNFSNGAGTVTAEPNMGMGGIPYWTSGAWNAPPSYAAGQPAWYENFGGYKP